MEAGALNEKTGRFLSLLEHELRTNLNGFIGTTQLISKLVTRRQQQSENITVDELRPFLDGLNQSNHEFQRMLDQMQDYNQLKQGQISLQSRAVDFVQLLQHSIRLFSLKAKEKNIDFLLTYHEDAAPIVYADAERLQQIMCSLLDNAIKFTNTGKVEVVVSATNDQSVTVTIHDTGIGIAADKLPLVFHQFTQAYTDDNGKSYQGLGLGLTLAKQLIELQNGSIDITSQLNQGTVVNFTIPTQTQVNQATTAISALKILLIKEELERLSDLENTLATAGCSYHQASLAEANYLLLQGASEWLPNIVLVTAKTFTQQIAYFARTLKGNRQLQGIRVVLVLPAGGQYIYEREQALINGYDSVINNMPGALFIETLATALNSWQQKGEVTVALKPKQITNRVLVVEDNLINQKVIRLLLSELGLEVEVAGNGNSALSLIDQQDYAAVFVDIGLPDINGFDVIKQLRTRDDYKSTLPTIVLTADAAFSDQKDYRARGVDAYLVKPLTIQQLRETLTPFFPTLMAHA
jgi:two-component system sensor histidine kinase/response regulator